jgi:hypothetical protein
VAIKDIPAVALNMAIEERIKRALIFLIAKFKSRSKSVISAM